VGNARICSGNELLAFHGHCEGKDKKNGIFEGLHGGWWIEWSGETTRSAEGKWVSGRVS